ncbi:MAG TPA: site-specific integrase [Roseiarcus sp.]|jgi:integrase|nr:site-specific integrase [Roseiarcus sp.]
MSVTNFKLRQLVNQLGDETRVFAAARSLAQEAAKQELRISDLILKVLAPRVWTPPPEGKVQELTDKKVRSLIVRTNRSGEKSNVFRKRWGGKTYKLALGGDLTREAARGVCERLAGKIVAGEDPIAEYREQAAQEKARLEAMREARRNPPQPEEVITVSRLVKNWGLSRGPKDKRTPRYVSGIVAALNRAFELAEFKNLPAQELDANCIKAMLEKVEKKSGPAARARVRSAIGSICKLAIKDGILANDPCAKLETEKTEERDHVLSTQDVQRIWRGTFKLPSPAGNFVRTLARTGMRRNEVLGMRRSEFDGNAWIVPKERMKAKKEFAVPITAAFLADLPPSGGSGDYVFGADGGPRLPSVSRIKAALDAAIAADKQAPMARWVLHDFRRSFTTLLADRGEDFDVLDLCLAHVPSNISKSGKTYQRSEKIEQRRELLEKWELVLTGKEPAARIAVDNTRQRRRSAS